MKQYPFAIAAKNKNQQIRKQSSSGAVFFQLASETISSGGVVFGARFDQNWTVIHDYGETTEKVFPFLGSKYVQSRIGDTFCQAKQFLEQGRPVLYSGTPCQIYGLHAFLGKTYENLITVDLICHGVPSPLVWHEYLRSYVSGADVQNVNFRDKTEGWRNFSLKLNFSDGQVYQKDLHSDLYMKGFLQDIFLRPSCYDCKFKGLNRTADITLGDLWNCETILPNFFDDNGVSCVLIQNKKGEALWDKTKKNFLTKTISLEDVMNSNPAAVNSVVRPYQRKIFFADRRLHMLEKLTQPPAKWQKPIRKIRRIWNRILNKSVVHLHPYHLTGKVTALFVDQKAECCGCSACFSVCKQKAVQMTEDSEGFLYPVIDYQLCIHCYQCVRHCPIKKQDPDSDYLSDRLRQCK